MIAFTCPHCGGRIHYDISEKGMKCEYCDSLITQASYQEYLDTKKAYQATELTCPQCGAVTLSYDNTLATFCSYCGSSVLFQTRVRQEQKPDGILPFAFKRQAAMNRYREKVDRVLLAPDWVHEEGELHATGLYVPYYEYSAAMRQPGEFTGKTSTSYGRYTEVKEYKVSGVVRADYRGTRFDAAMAFPDAMSETIDTFDWNKAESFQPGYVAGFYADGSDVEPGEYDPVALELIRQDINGKNILYSGMSLDTNQPANESNISLKRRKLLFPVWLLTHRVGKDRICYGAINGRTGEVAADIPLDGGKFVMVSLILAAVFSLLLNFIATIKPSVFLVISMLITALFGAVLGSLANDVYIRENHLDDIGRVGYESFASSLKRSIWRSKNGRGRPRRFLGFVKWVVIGLILFFAAPLAVVILGEVLHLSERLQTDIFTGLVILVFVFQFFLSSLRKKLSLGGTGVPGGYKWSFSVPKLIAFSVMWKIWLALAAGAMVLVSRTVEDMWYYGAGALNIIVSFWAAFDLIRKQNRLSSREIPVFTLKRGGQE